MPAKPIMTASSSSRLLVKLLKSPQSPESLYWNRPCTAHLVGLFAEEVFRPMLPV